MSLQENFDNISQKIQNINKDVRLIAVSKSVEHEAVRQMHEIGQIDFGENRVQSLKTKVENLKDLPINWHFIGRLQTNKINNLIELNPTMWQSCDSLQRALEFDKRLAKKGKTLDTLLQINSANEDEKQGVMPQNAKEVYEQILSSCKQINLVGVMSIGAFSQDEKEVQKSFEITRGIFEDLSSYGARYCSMGMSGDFELAIKCGSNMVRIGSVLFH